MEKILSYINSNWLPVSIGVFFIGLFVYLTFSGNQLCDCAKTETYRDGTSKNSTHGRTFYRYYHK